MTGLQLSFKRVILEEDMDSIVETVISKFRERSELGKKKYGVTLDRTDLSLLDWIQHAQEEHMDAILYLEKLKQQYKNENKHCTDSGGNCTRTHETDKFSPVIVYFPEKR